MTESSYRCNIIIQFLKLSEVSCCSLQSIKFNSQRFIHSVTQIPAKKRITSTYYNNIILQNDSRKFLPNFLLTSIFIPFFSIFPSPVIPGLIFTLGTGFSFFFLDYPTSRSCAKLIYVAPCEGIKDSHGFWIPRPGFWIPITGFQIFQWTWIPDSSCQ